MIALEEPEAHSFPYYTKYLAERIAPDRRNQYFISTHNPYFLLSLIEKTPISELAVYMTYYKNYQTKVKELGREKLETLWEGNLMFSSTRRISLRGSNDTCVECKPDKVLVHALGVPRKRIRHLGGKANICKALEKSCGLIGLMDEDLLSVQPPYLRNLRLVGEFRSLKLLHDSQRNNYVIMLSQRLEEWVLEAAKDAGVNVRDYGLPSDGEELHKVVNIRVEHFRRLVLDLRGKSVMLENLEATLRKCLNRLRNNERGTCTINLF